MKAKGFRLEFLLALMFPFLFVACTNDEFEDDFDVYADVFIIKRKINDEIKTANAYYVYGNDAIASATVVPRQDAGSPVSLMPLDNLKFDYYYVPDSTEYTDITPLTGNYDFEIVSVKGTEIQKTDLLKDINPALPEIISTTFTPTTSTLTVTWHKLTETDIILLRLINKKGNIYFISYALANTVTEFQIGSGSGNWISSAKLGDELVLQIQSVTIEDDADVNYSLYNIEAIALAEKDIIWGQ